MRFGIVASVGDITPYLNNLKSTFNVSNIDHRSAVVIIDTMDEFMDMWRAVFNCPIILSMTGPYGDVDAPYRIEICESDPREP